ncbi:glycerophosphodiester phosphodiesterase family protein [Planomicrobium sp. CPCC 101079]|uniref:glycerophosphodiester phosphodiesterase family protein n=1 Tax=Planomicrobium sp. CPCC 101079 TaxID=2599618 RepID=UPI0011B7506E|nr:glycerophosphodiester phosphodiesterase family protein [Planomicrobium sp. CPCC 101079]TWT01135.1 glycerophosphodiester phosphodiesterase [Planomicrobium sp. CPCC 101079]
MRIKNGTALMDPDKFLIIAHRGASVQAPEHTMAAYRLAKELEADYLEVDVQMSKDNVLVSIHDLTVDRTTDGSGVVTDMTLAELKRLDAGSWFNQKYPDMAKEEYTKQKIPTLQEIIDEFGKSVNYYIETKKPEQNEGIEDELFELLGQNGLLDESLPEGKVVIQSFSEESLKRMRTFSRKIPLIKLERDPITGPDARKRFEEVCEYAVGIGTYFERIDEDYIKTAKESGLLVHLYTVNSSEIADKWKGIGAHGIFTDNIPGTRV